MRDTGDIEGSITSERASERAGVHPLTGNRARMTREACLHRWLTRIIIESREGRRER